MPEAPAAPATPPKRRTLLIMLPVVVFATIALLFAFALQKGDPNKLPSALIGKPAPRLTLAPLEGLADNGIAVPGWSGEDLVRGQPAVVNFFASWCVPCVQEHPYLMDLRKETGIRILGVNHKDPAPGGRRFIGRFGNPYAAVGVDPDGRVAIEWGVYGMPETFVVDGAGRIMAKHVGPITTDTLRSVIVPALERAKAASAAAGQPPGTR